MQPELRGASAALAAALALELGVGVVLDVVVRQQLLLRVELHPAGVAAELEGRWQFNSIFWPEKLGHYRSEVPFEGCAMNPKLNRQLTLSKILYYLWNKIGDFLNAF